MGAGAAMKGDGKKNPRTQYVVLGGVSVVGLAVLFRMMSGGPQAAPAASVTGGYDAAPAFVPPAPAGGGGAALASVNWPKAIARDPFDSELVFPPPAPAPVAPVAPKVEPVVVVAPPPVDVAAVAREKIQLKGTVLGDRPLAMLNGRVYRVGEVVEGFKIVEIGKNRMTVSRDGTRVVLEVN